MLKSPPGFSRTAVGGLLSSRLDRLFQRYLCSDEQYLK
jgi:hypothetical protein